MFLNLIQIFLPTSRKGQICDCCHRQSVICCSSHSYIWKTKQDRPVVTMEHCWFCFCISRILSQARISGNVLVSNKKICSDIHTVSCLTWHQTAAVVRRYVDDAKVEQEADRLFSQCDSCFCYYILNSLAENFENMVLYAILNFIF